MAISRKDQNDYAILSYERFRHACKTGAHCEEIAPVSLTSGATGLVAADHLPHESVFNRLRKLSSCFSIGGTITSGNASSLSDGASAVALVNAELARSFCLSNRILAKIVTYADASAAPDEFAMAPAKAIQKVLTCAHLSVEQIDLWEINEAFAMVVLVTQQTLGIDPTTINVNGGALASGHPLGSSGCRILVSLLHQLSHSQY